ncbi:tripartite tricarboxylate transporter permease [Methanosphaera sp. WGK6]|uniref:tripartite tricarboxylate transporter permease n=1 Tax=Methanosphaera sp. WGK6 TaxID=1561964 RepID=UPI00084C924C|nr:tripartite tricarboxylate transporter permease [Methanosphaera sp. WGK6]OED30447.1 membrane protein [Methanosphaera sp. WGK6]
MITIFLALIIGIIFGTITGIIPGLHVNTVGIIIFSISSKLLKNTSALVLCTFFVAISLTHAMLEFIPSLLLGVPNEDTILSIQPGHKLLLNGKGRKAIRLISFGGYGSIISLIVTMPILFIILPLVYNNLKEYIAYFLIIAMMIIIYKTNRTMITCLASVVIFLISGILGIVILTSNLGSNLGLLCMLSGAFSISNLIYSINNNSNIPPQNKNRSIVLDSKFKKSVFAGSISGCILGLLPGLGPAQGTLLAQILTFSKNITSEDFLVTNSGVNVSDTLFSLLAIYLISNPRSAISVYVNILIQNITIYHIIFFIFVSLISVSIACIISIKIGDYLIKHIQQINYKKINIIIIISITCLIILFTIFTNGCIWYVILCYITSIALGILTNSLDLSKSNLMGILIIPSILIYLGLI